MPSIFVGSSSEAKTYAEDVCLVLEELDVKATLWTDFKAFPPGLTIIEGIERVAGGHDAAVLIATPDDRTVSRGSTSWTPRDNVIYEAAYFAARFGRAKAIIIKIGDAHLPSDLDGLVYFVVEPPARNARGGYDQDRFRRALKGKLQPWVDATAVTMPASDPASLLPRLTEVLQTKLAFLRDEQWGDQFDARAADLLNQLAEALESDKGINHELIDKIATLSLPHATGIYAIDVLGPSGWLSPVAFRYLAVQIREYIRRNVEVERWNLVVSSQLGEAIQRALGAVRGSKTLFDDPPSLAWQRGAPRLEFCRVLLWSESELVSHVAESVIAIHEAFNVPLFYLETPNHDPRRDVDFIFFANNSRALDGFYGVRANDYQTNPIKNGRIPGLGQDAARWFWELFQDPGRTALFAVDARAAAVDRRRRGVALRPGQARDP